MVSIGNISFTKPKDKSIPKLLEKSSQKKDKSILQFMEKSIQNLGFSSLWKVDVYSNFVMKNKEEVSQAENELNNPYLKNEDVPELEMVKKNKILSCDKKEYEIEKYMEKIKINSEDFHDDYTYNRCLKCKNDINKYFCFICNKNICEKCGEECKNNKHLPKNLEEINVKDNINKIKAILKNLIIPIKKEEIIIKDIIEYIDKYTKNIDIKNSIIEDFSYKNKVEINEDILLIYQIISKDYINYFHYKNIEKMLTYLNKEYNVNSNCKYEGYGKILLENGEYYIGEFKNNLRNGKGLYICKNRWLIDFGDFDGSFEGSGHIEKHFYDYYIGEWKDNLPYGKGILCFKNGEKYIGDFINDKVGEYGNIFLKDGEYNIDEWKNNLKHENGIIYYNKGNIKYEGDWINFQKGGYGKYIYESGNYYIGEWKDDLRNGKGILYYKNGNIKYEGDFINDKFDGYGKYIKLYC